MDRFRGIYGLFPGRIGLSDKDIFKDRSVFDPRILQDHTESPPQIMPSHIPYIFSADFYLSLIYFIKSHEQIDKCRLSAACGTYYRNALSGLYVKIEILDQRLVRGI